MKRDPIEEFVTFNKRFLGRYPQLLLQKFERMGSGPFGFFRGSFHLFAHDMVNGVLDPWQNSNPFTSVETALVGDIHSENYGTFKASDGSIQYDINDFDETTSGSFDFDCKRAATSLFLASADQKLSLTAMVGISEAFARSYVAAIESREDKGGAGEFEVSADKPPDVTVVRTLFKEAERAHRAEFIEKMTEEKKGRLTIRRGPKYFDLRPEHAAQCGRLVADYLKRMEKEGPKRAWAYELAEACGRIAGCGSLGRLRYAILLAGKEEPAAKHVLLEFKESLPSAYDEWRGRKTGKAALEARAEEVVGVQRVMQSASNPFLGFATDNGMSFQVKELSPRDLRLDWSDVRGQDGFLRLAGLYGELLAKAHLRTGARRTIHEALKDRKDVFVKRVTAFALAYSELVEDDHRLFVKNRSSFERLLLK